MRYLNHAFVVIVVVSFIGALLIFVLNREQKGGAVACTMDALICPDGTAVGRSGPSCTFTPCPSPAISDDIQEMIDVKKDLITLSSPVPGAIITSPVTITGMARGTWFFEASFPITIVDWDGRIIGEGIATADEDWMTTEFVPYTATISFTVPSDTPYKRGIVILQKDNPSGLPEHDDALEIPVTF